MIKKVELKKKVTAKLKEKVQPKEIKQKVPKEDLKKIESGVKKSAKKAVKEAHEGMPESTKRMLARLDKLDVFIKDLVEDEGVDNVRPEEITEMLMIKARHNAFTYTEETDPSKIILWLINCILFRSDEVFGVVKAHLLKTKG